jgi:hypothetical protein
MLKMGWHPKMMEDFGAGSTSTVEACREKIKDCEALLLRVVVRHRIRRQRDQFDHGTGACQCLASRASQCSPYSRSEKASFYILTLPGDVLTGFRKGVVLRMRY